MVVLAKTSFSIQARAGQDMHMARGGRADTHAEVGLGKLTESRSHRVAPAGWNVGVVRHAQVRPTNERPRTSFSTDPMDWTTQIILAVLTILAGYVIASQPWEMSSTYSRSSLGGDADPSRRPSIFGGSCCASVLVRAD